MLRWWSCICGETLPLVRPTCLVAHPDGGRRQRWRPSSTWAWLVSCMAGGACWMLMLYITPNKLRQICSDLALTASIAAPAD